MSNPARLPYDLRLQIGKALDRLVCDESTPEQVERFIRTFADFGLVVSTSPVEDMVVPNIAEIREALSDETISSYPDFTKAVGAALDQLERFHAARSPSPSQHVEPFQARVQPWMMACFGAMLAGDREERNHRFLEEALELVQSTGCTAHEAHQLVDYVYGRDIGEPHQEVGGVMVTLAALCLANQLDMHQCGETELARIWTKVEAIRAKQAAKPKHSPLPGPTTCGLPDPTTRDCPNMQEVGGGMDGERYRCAVCGKGYFLDYEEMK